MRGSKKRANPAGVVLIMELTRKSRRRFQDRVGSVQFTVLTLQLGQTLSLVGGGTGTVSGIDPGLQDPVTQRLAVDTQLVGKCVRWPRPMWLRSGGLPRPCG